MTPRSSRRALAVAVLLGTTALGLATPGVPTLTESQARWSALPAGEQSALAARLQAWDALSLAEREEQRGRYQSWLALEQDERARLRAAASQFAALPVEEQARLRNVFTHLDVMQQRGWRLGPDLGADWPRLQPLFAYVPVEQRAAALLALKQLDATGRDDLAALAQRIPPQAREGFRREFLQQPAAQRGAWLHQRRNQ